MVEQPYQYQRRELAEPDWRRLPGWAGVTREEWESAQWQRAHSVKNARQLRDVTGDAAGARLSDAFLADLERDQRERATMSMLIPPQMLNTIAPAVAAPPDRRVHRRVVRRPGAPVHAAGVQRPAAGVAVAPATRRGTRCTRPRCGRSRG